MTLKSKISFTLILGKSSEFGNVSLTFILPFFLRKNEAYPLIADIWDRLKKKKTLEYFKKI